MSTPKKTMPKSVKFALGGASGMVATVFVQPLDLVKNRMQLMGEGGTARVTSFQVIKTIIRTEGFTAMYSGLSAGLLRQATYTTTRLGVYTSLFETMSELPVDQRRNYSNVFNAIARITKEEGVLTLWRGCGPTMARAMVVNAAQLASYSQAKQGILSTGYFSEGLMLHFVASMISGLVTTIASMPVDIIKTRIQNMKVIDGKPEYKGTMDVLSRIIKNEGFFSLWKGFTPYYARLGPHTVLTFIALEQMNKAYRKIILGDDSDQSSL